MPGPEEAILEWSGRGEVCEAGNFSEFIYNPLRLLLVAFGLIYQLVGKPEVMLSKEIILAWDISTAKFQFL